MLTSPGFASDSAFSVFSTARARAAGVSGPPPLVVATSYAFWYDGDGTATGCGLPTTAEGCSVLLQSLLCDLRTL